MGDGVVALGGGLVALYALVDAIAASRGNRLRRIAIRGRRWDYLLAAETLAPGPQNPAAQALWAILSRE